MFWPMEQPLCRVRQWPHRAVRSKISGGKTGHRQSAPTGRICRVAQIVQATAENQIVTGHRTARQTGKRQSRQFISLFRHLRLPFGNLPSSRPEPEMAEQMAANFVKKL